MTTPLPQGTISLDEAVERIARLENRKLTTLYRDEADAAWRTLCKLAPVAARIMTGDGLLRKPDPVQFDGFADRYWKFAEALRYPNGEEIVDIIPSYNLNDEHGHKHSGAQLVFLESEIDAAWWESMKPKTRVEAIAKWLRGRYSTRPPDSAKDLANDLQADFVDVHRNTVARAAKLAWPS